MTVQQYCLRWNNHQPNFISVFSSLLSSQSLVDVTLAAEGKQLQAHKVVLSACSSYFQALFATNPCKHPIVILKDVKFSDLKVMVDFMYHGEVSVSQEQLPCILKTAEMLKIKGLTEIPVENSSAKCQNYNTENSDIPTHEDEHWNAEEPNRSPSSPSSKRKRLKKNVICTATVTEQTETASNEILLSTVDNVFETVLKTEPDRHSTDNSLHRYSTTPTPIQSIHPGTSQHRESEPTHQIITQVTPPEVSASQNLECSSVEIPRTCSTQHTTSVSPSTTTAAAHTFPPSAPPTPPPAAAPPSEHMGPKRGRFLQRQPRVVRRDADGGNELAQFLALPPAARLIGRQRSEPAPCRPASPPQPPDCPTIRPPGDHLLVKQHSHPLLPAKGNENTTRSSHCPAVRAGPALGCNYCWNTVDNHGRILRRKTKYHCPECQTNLCIVPCFQEYHKCHVEKPSNADPSLPPPIAKLFPKSSS